MGELGVYSEWQLSTLDGGTALGILHVYALGNNWSEGSQQRWDYFFNNGDRITVALTHANYKQFLSRGRFRIFGSIIERQGDRHALIMDGDYSSKPRHRSRALSGDPSICG